MTVHSGGFFVPEFLVLWILPLIIFKLLFFNGIKNNIEYIIYMSCIYFLYNYYIWKI